MLLIHIVDPSVDLITALNNGVRPELEEVSTYFVWYENEPAEIITREEAMTLAERHDLKVKFPAVWS
jgi:hypothetical protein